MGKRLLFLTTWDFSDGPSTGITKKIKSQIKVFLKQGYEVDYTYISDNYVWIYEKGIRHKIGKTKIGRKFSANLYLANYFRDKRYDFVYNRYGLSDPFFLSLLKRLHENGCTIVVEIPTYPYDREKQSGLLWDILFKIDKIYRVKMNGVVDRIYTYSEDNQIWGIPTICSSNGIDFDLVSMRKVEKKRESINLIAVAGLAKWHGYDRILRGMGEYYKEGEKREVQFHIVGEGSPIEEYKRIVEKYEIAEHVIFYGLKTGRELDSIYDQCSIGVENLGFHRTGVYRASTLKAREYAAKGLPFITSLKLDIFENEKFVLHVPADESNIDVNEIVAFYDELYLNKDAQELARNIREKAKSICDICVTMLPVIEYFKSKENK